MAPRIKAPERTDAELVAATLAGDREAFGAIYDRYGNVIYTVCVRLLGRRDDAADCAADVFLKAAERLHQLREPEKLKAWLYAIARNEVTRRQRERSREVLTAAVDDSPWTPVPAGPDDGVPTSGSVTDTELIGRLLREATAGLTDRDRLVAELGLAQGLTGDDLADALGVKTNHAYVLLHRVRGRLEQSVTAILVARHGRDDCPDLERVLKGWDGDLTVVLRKRVSRHIDRCEVCGHRRRLVPAGLFDAAPVLAAPIAVRQRILAEVDIATSAARPWSADGFPARRRSGRRLLTGALAVIVVLVVLAGFALVRDPGLTVLADEAGVATTTTMIAASDGDPDASAGGGDDTPGSTVVDGDDTTGDPMGLPPGGAADTPSTITDQPGSDSGAGPIGPDDPVAPDVIPPPVPIPGPQVTVAGPGVLTVTPDSLDFGITATTRPLVVANTGGSVASFTVVSSDAAFTVPAVGVSVAPGTQQAITVVLNRSMLDDGHRAATLTLHTSIGDRSVGVSATGARGPTIVSFDGPSQFGITPAASCSFAVKATDASGVASVSIEWAELTGSSSGSRALVLTAGSWRGSQTVVNPDPATGGNVIWRVVASDSLGNVTTSAYQSTGLGSVCLV